MNYLALISFTLLMFYSCAKKSEGSIYILPENYRGYVIILYNQESGFEKEYKGNKRIYRIPSSGVLRTQFEENYTWTEFPLFYYGKVNEQKEITATIGQKEYLEEGISVSMPSMGKSYTNIDGSSSVSYSTFYVGTKSQIEDASNQLEKIHVADLVLPR